VPSTVLTLLVLSHLDIKGPAVRDLITTVLSVALFVTAGLLIFRRHYWRSLGGTLPSFRQPERLG
jgi:hypothetical protein